MLFNSWVFLLAFLPVLLLGYYLLPVRHGLAWLVLGSLIYYGWWNPAYLGLILGSSFFNYLLGQRLCRRPSSRSLMIVGVGANLALLAYFKYADFLLANLAQLSTQSYATQDIVLPLAISFYTFFQIAYLVDAWQGKVEREPFLNYLLFVSYFPHLIAGPIVHHRELMPQFRVPRPANPGRYLAAGFALFAFALLKKTVLADSLGLHADQVFTAADAGLPILSRDAWTGLLSYSFQIYFDFSAYCEMAIACSWMLGIRLPLNFYAPYRALSIIEFWRHWHMTLSRFLRDYLYIPLGGNRHGKGRRYLNLGITMLLGGLWHGAGWNFVVWGAIHGLLLAAAHAWRDAQLWRLPALLSGPLTFLAVCLAWAFFRAHTLDGALHLLATMAGLADVQGSTSLIGSPVRVFGYLAVAAVAIWALPPLMKIFATQQMVTPPIPGQMLEASQLGFHFSRPWALLCGLGFFVALYYMAAGEYVEFIYRFF